MTIRSELRASVHRVGRLVFGDRLGLVLWLALAACYCFLWRVEFLITDSNLFANMLVALSDGNLAITEFRFPLDTVGGQQVQQGLTAHDGAYYGRNYGQVALAVPVLWALQGLAAFFDVRLLLLAMWSGLLVVLGQQIGVLADAPRRGQLAGAVLAGLAVIGSVGVATDVDGRLLPVIALQLVNLIAAAGIGLLVYRLIGRFHGRRVGVVAALATGLATPVAFWATFPKRHVLVGALVLVGILCFAISRDEGYPGRSRLVCRAGAYAAMGLVAWIHAAEGFVLVLTLAGVDLATAERRDPRALAVIGSALVLALVPTLLTNAAITGNPLLPPRLVGGAASGNILNDMAAGDGPVVAGSLVAGVGMITLPMAVGPIETVLDLFDRLWSVISGGIGALDDPDRLWHTFVRSGNYEQFFQWGPPYEPYELSVLESMPLVGGVIVFPVVAARDAWGRFNEGWDGMPWPQSPRGQTDALVVAIAVVVTVVYLSRLPLHGQLTVRYLFVLYPLGAYGLARFPPIRHAINTAPRSLIGGAGVGLLGTLIAGTLLLSALDPARAEAVQAHALIHLALATALASSVVADTFVSNRDGSTPLAVGLGVTGGATTGYYLLAGLEYFSDGAYALDLARIVAELVSIL